MDGNKRVQRRICVSPPRNQPTEGFDLFDLQNVFGRTAYPTGDLEEQKDEQANPAFRVADLLIRARKLLDDPEHWCQGIFRQDKSFCLAGAVIAEASIEGHDYRWPVRHSDSIGDMFQDDLVYAARWVLSVVIGTEMNVPYMTVRHIQGWNDNPKRKHEEVLEALDKAIRFELSDAYARAVLRRASEENFIELLDGHGIDYSIPDSGVMVTLKRVMSLSESPYGHAITKEHT